MSSFCSTYKLVVPSSAGTTISPSMIAWTSGVRQMPWNRCEQRKTLPGGSTGFRR